MFNYCPKCASGNINFNKNVFKCSDCNMVYYHNTAAATGCLIIVPSNDKQESNSLLFTVRGKDPGKGLLDLPGGFIDPKEGILEGLFRELKEEIGWVPKIPEGKNLEDIFTLFASFSNVYHYKGFDYNTCDIYFKILAHDITAQNLHPQEGEIAKICLLKPEEIDLNLFAFESTKHAVRKYLNNIV